MSTPKRSRQMRTPASSSLEMPCARTPAAQTSGRENVPTNELYRLLDRFGAGIAAVRVVQRSLQQREVSGDEHTTLGLAISWLDRCHDHLDALCSKLGSTPRPPSELDTAAAIWALDAARPSTPSEPSRTRPPDSAERSSGGRANREDS